MPFKKDQEGYVYFIASIPNGLIKIGWSKDPRRRFEILSFMSPVPLRLLAIRQCRRESEGRIHERFWQIRHHGEWFRPSTDLMKFIKQWAKPYQEPVGTLNGDRTHSLGFFGLQGEGPWSIFEVATVTGKSEKAVLRIAEKLMLNFSFDSHGMEMFDRKSIKSILRNATTKR